MLYVVTGPGPCYDVELVPGAGTDGPARAEERVGVTVSRVLTELHTPPSPHSPARPLLRGLGYSSDRASVPQHLLLCDISLIRNQSELIVTDLRRRPSLSFYRNNFPALHALEISDIRSKCY